MSDVRNRLRALDELDPPEMWADATRRQPRTSIDLSRPSPLRKAVVIVGAFTMTLAATGFLVYAFNSSGPRRPVSPDRTDPTGDVQPSTSVRDPASLVVQSFPVGAPAGAIAAGDGWVWVATNDFDGEGAKLDKIDPSTGEVTSSISLPGDPPYLAAGGGNVWAPVNLGGGKPFMLQIDAATGVIVDRWPGLFGPVVLAADGTIWAVEDAVGDRPEVVQLDVTSRSVVARVPIASEPFDMVEAAGSIWVLHLPDAGTREADADLIRIDAGSSSVLASLDVQPGGYWLAGNDQGVWLSSILSDRRGTSVFVSASDNTVTSFGNIYNFRPFDVADGRVWFLAGPHDGPIRGTCGINLETQVADVCGYDDSGPDLNAARDSAAYESTTNTVWTGVYLKAQVVRVQAP